MNTDKKNFLNEVDKIVERGREEAKKHSEELGSQYAYLSGFLIGELHHAYITIEHARDELRALHQELNSIGEI